MYLLIDREEKLFLLEGEHNNQYTTDSLVLFRQLTRLLTLQRDHRRKQNVEKMLRAGQRSDQKTATGVGS